MAKQYTKKLIHDTFINMLNEKPLKKITVKELACACEINRNAFYYYYSDLYELLSEIFEEELQRVITEFNETLSWEDSFKVATKFALANKKAIYNVYDSMQQEELIRYIYNVSGNMMERYVNNRDKNVSTSESDKALLVAFFQCALSGMVIRWIHSGMKEEPEEIIQRIGFLLDGTVETALTRSATINELSNFLDI